MAVAAAADQSQLARLDKLQCGRCCEIFDLLALHGNTEVAASAGIHILPTISAQPGGATAGAGHAGDVPAVIRDADIRFFGVVGFAPRPTEGTGRGACSTVHFLCSVENIFLMVIIFAWMP